MTILSLVISVVIIIDGGKCPPGVLQDSSEVWVSLSGMSATERTSFSSLPRVSAGPSGLSENFTVAGGTWIVR